MRVQRSGEGDLAAGCGAFLDLVERVVGLFSVDDEDDGL